MRPALSRSLVLIALAALCAALVATHTGGAVAPEQPATIDAPFHSELASRISGPSTNLSNGITFEHANFQDPTNMISEPDIVIDNQGGIYVSGPGGSATQSSWFWKSDDKGNQWHLIGCPLKSNCQNGGGDTEIVTANDNADGGPDMFGSDLQTLACNSTFRSLDGGKVWTASEGCFPGTDRQWMGIYDPNASPTGRRIYLSSNGLAIGCYFLVSTDNGVTYLPSDGADGGIGGSCMGRHIVNPANGHIYVPGTSNTKVSVNGGVSFLNRPRPSGVQANFFANIALDTAGNLWQGWTTSCSNPPVTPCKAFVAYSTDEAQTWSDPIQVNTGPGSPVGTSPDLRQMLFPWTVVGDPGRVAIVYYATTNTARTGGFPGGITALWNTYMSISTNAISANPTWTQVQADEHVMHRAVVCTGGFPGCLTANADRSMADFFAIDKDPQGRVYIAYNENSDLSEVTPGQFIGKPIDAVYRLRTGPSLYAAQGNLLPHPTPPSVDITSASYTAGTVTAAGTHGLPPGNWSPDAAGDAPFPVVPVTSANHPALDILEVSASDNGSDLTFKLKMADLSPAALAEALTAGGTPSWMVTWWHGRAGIGPAAMAASGPFHSHWFVKWLGASNFVYGKVGSIDFAALGAPTPKYMTYVPLGTATGTVVGNEITISVPFASLGGLTIGDKIDHVGAFSMVEKVDVTKNDWADQVKSFSYRITGLLPAQGGSHMPDGYVEVALDQDFTDPVLATLSSADNSWTADIPGAPTAGTVYVRQVLAKDLYTPLWDDVQAGPIDQMNYGPTAVTVRSFIARRNGQVVVLRWRTASEAQTLGYNLYRHRVKLNKRPIPSVGSAGGHTYVWRDRRPGKAPRYSLEAVRRDGSSVRLGRAVVSRS